MSELRAMLIDTLLKQLMRPSGTGLVYQIAGQLTLFACMAQTLQIQCCS